MQLPDGYADVSAKSDLEAEYSNLVWYWVRKYERPNILAEDLYQEGVIGLLKAYGAYDPEQGKFAIYANSCVRGAILEYIRNNRCLIRVGRKTESIKFCDINTSLTPDGRTYEETIPIDYCLSTTVCNQVVAKQAVDYLKGKEHEVIKKYYFQDIEQPKIAKQMGISESRVSQIHREALTRMKNILGVSK